MTWLKPTFRVQRGVAAVNGHFTINLPPATIAVLEVDTANNLSRYEVLGCNASPVWVPTPTLAALLRERGEQL